MQKKTNFSKVLKTEAKRNKRKYISTSTKAVRKKNLALEHHDPEKLATFLIHLKHIHFIVIQII